MLNFSTYFTSAFPVFLKFCRVETAEKRRYVPERNSWVASGTRKAEYIDYRVSTSVPTQRYRKNEAKIRPRESPVG